jgi:NADPH-dependent curcumin reductase CurA
MLRREQTDTSQLLEMGCTLLYPELEQTRSTPAKLIICLQATQPVLLDFFNAENIGGRSKEAVLYLQSSIMSLTNHQFRLAARPEGLPKRSDFNYTEEPVRDPGAGQILVKILYLSLDPAMRGWMNEGKSYIAPVDIGAVMRAGAVGKVIASQNPGFAVGDHVVGMFGVQEYALSDGKGVSKVDTRLAPLPVFLGTLGMPGLTAYFGLLEVGALKAGDTVVVSGAAGAVGMPVGQIAKIKGCRAVGIAGGPAKCEYLVKELGFDAWIDYKKDDVKEALREQCPNGINVYFDNVGGAILDAALTRLARGARVVISGAISQYNSTTGVKGPENYLSLLVNSARMEGFVVFNYAARYAEALREMAGWYSAGKLKSCEDIAEGFATFPETLLRLFSGENFGKQVLKVAGA